MKFEKISVIGLGYIGLPTAAVFASRKIQVAGVDVVQATVDIINEGKIHIVEPELDILVHAAVTEGYLKASVQATAADAFIIAVPTPFKDDHKPDLSFIQAAAKTIAPVLKKGDLVILESTSPVGTTEKISDWLAEYRNDLVFPSDIKQENIDVNIAYCPERVLPGHIVREIVENDRIIGGITPDCSEKAVALYKIFVQGKCLTTNAKTAEMTKLSENASRDVNIAIANEFSILCDQYGINVWEMIELANRHPRINILQPGPGVGGHCIAVDPWFLISSSNDKAVLLKAARMVNDQKPGWVIEKVNQALLDFTGKSNDPVSKFRVACLGLSFKANIDDLRESPALDIVKTLSENQQMEITVVEPNITGLPDSLSGKQITLVNLEEAIEESDLLLLLVDHDEFKSLSKESYENKNYLDTRGIWSR